MSTHYAKYASNRFQVEYIGTKQRGDCIKTIQVSRGWRRRSTPFPTIVLLFSPDGTQVLSNSERGICVWEATSGKLTAGPLAGADGSSVLSATYLPDGRYIIVVSDDGIIKKWDAVTNSLVWETEMDKRQIDLSKTELVAFSPDRKIIVIGDNQGTIQIWNVDTREQDSEPLKGDSSFISCFSFSPDGQYLASGSGDGRITIWDMDRREIKTEPLRLHAGVVAAVDFSPSGTSIVSGSVDRIILLWNAFTGEVLREIKCDDEVCSVTFSSNGLLLLAGGWKWMSMWNATDITAAGKVFQVEGAIWQVSFSADSNRFVSASGWAINSIKYGEEFLLDGGKIQTWDVSRGVDEANRTFEEKRRIWAIALSSSGKFIATLLCRDKNIYLWDMHTGEVVKKLKLDSLANSISFSPINDQLIAFGSNDGKVRVWDITHDKSVTIGNHKQSVSSVTFSPSDGTHLASGSWDKTICVWNVERRESVVGPLIGHEHFVMSVAYSPGGKRLASGSIDKTVRIWNSETGELLSTLNGHSRWINSVAYSFDGSRIVSGSDDMSILVWNVQNGQIVCGPITGHRELVSSVCFSPDGTRILSGSWDNTARVWDAVSGRLLFPPFGGHAGAITSVCFFPDKKRFATGSYDGEIRIWTLDTTPNDTNWDLRDDNWIADKNGKLMMWIPTDLRTRLYSPRCTSILNRSYYLKLKLSTE